MRRVGAWLTRSALKNPRDTAARLADAGVTMGSIMLNDFSGARAEVPFDTHDPHKIAELADALALAGLEVTLTTWVMPHAGFIAGMGRDLPPLLERCEATGLILDAEEPWVRAIDPMPDEVAGEAIREAFPEDVLVMTAIGSAKRERLDGLAAVVDVFSPQAYATTRAGNPDTIVQYCKAAWETKFGEPREGWLMGLACYRQPVPARTYMQPCLDRTAAAGVTDICYWSHKPILERQDVRAVIQGIEVDDPAPPSEGAGVMVWTDMEALPSGVEDSDVGKAQALLVNAVHDYGPSVDPGRIDRMPGPRTQGALEAYQEVAGLAVTGVVDGATWWSLGAL